MKEPVFEGTVLEGKERRFTVIKLRAKKTTGLAPWLVRNEYDLRKYVRKEKIEQLNEVLNDVFEEIRIGRELDGKNPQNSYIVVNVDEPYVGEIIGILKRHGHWD